MHLFTISFILRKMQTLQRFIIQQRFAVTKYYIGLVHIDKQPGDDFLLHRQGFYLNNPFKEFYFSFHYDLTNFYIKGVQKNLPFDSLVCSYLSLCLLDL